MSECDACEEANTLSHRGRKNQIYSKTRTWRKYKLNIL